jgi:hypothetical protein
MASKSPYAGVGIGEGIGAGVESAAYANKAYNEALKAAQSGELDLAKLNAADRTNLLHYSITGVVSNMNTKMKTQEIAEIARAHSDTAKLANDTRQDANINALTKTYLAGKPMPTDEEQDQAYTRAKAQVLGTSVNKGGKTYYFNSKDEADKFKKAADEADKFKKAAKG